MNLQYLAVGGQPVHFGHVDVEKDNIGVLFLRELNSLQPVRGDGNHLHIIYSGEHQTGIAARFLNIVGDEHPHFLV
jgi:hypothetical protein